MAGAHGRIEAAPFELLFAFDMTLPGRQVTTEAVLAVTGVVEETDLDHFLDAALHEVQAVGHAAGCVGDHECAGRIQIAIRTDQGVRPDFAVFLLDFGDVEPVECC